MRRSAFVLGPFARGSRRAARLPYGAQHLGIQGYDVAYGDPDAGVAGSHVLLRSMVKMVHRLSGWPVLEPVLEPGMLRNADLVVCFLEDNLSVLAPVLRVVRRGRRRASTALVVVWLAERVGTMNPRERRRWRRRLMAFGRVVVLSSNQIQILTTALDLPAGLVRFVPFGVEPLDVAPDGAANRVLTVGNDVGRDFETFVAALDGAEVRATVLTNATHRERLLNTGTVEVTGPASRAGYLAMLAEAGIVVSVTKPLAYPGGQTSLLEALQLGKACVVTRSEALTDYLGDEDALLVPPGDAPALRAAVERLRDDDVLRASLGASAARSAARFTEQAMWAGIARSVVEQ